MTPVRLTLPALTITAGGRVLAEDVRAMLGEIRIHHRLSLPGQCELVFFGELPEATMERLQPGAALGVETPDGPPLFEGEVTAIDHVYEPAQGRQFRVRGYDRLHRLRKHQPIRSHVEVGFGDLVRELVSPIGVAVEMPSVNLAWPRLIQHGQTDFELLEQVAGACGLHFALRGETLHLFTLEGTGDVMSLQFGGNLLEARIEVNGDPACRAVVAEGWDVAHSEVRRGRAASPRIGRDVRAEAPPDRFGADGAAEFVHLSAPDDRHAEALAQSELDFRCAREVVFRGVAEGNSRLRPGARVTLSGVAASVSGGYVLTEVCHVLGGERGFVTEVSSYPAAPRRRKSGASMAFGRVTSVDDPQRLGRVQVTLPACHGVETDWLPIVAPGAGREKGLVALPDVGDTVCILCAQEDPTFGVVLGGIFGIEGPADPGIEGGAVRRFLLQSAGGQTLTFDDAAKTMRMENPDGGYMQFGPDGAVFHAATDLRIEAPGRTITVSGKAIDFEQA